ncbi:pleiotropic regulator 1 [Heptranchias perlo]|uniref:pleiotropic regulator 1 n=1 Tax=Heptranchias perlo TaxID=212740 RepID=UPI00355958ED
MVEEVQKHSVHTLVFRSLKRTHDMFVSDHAKPIAVDERSYKLKMNVKLQTEYSPVLHMPILKEIREKSSQSDSYNHGHYDLNHGQESEYIITGTHPYPSGPGVALTADTQVQKIPTEAGTQALAIALPPSQARQDANRNAASVADIHRHAGIAERSQPPVSSMALMEAGGPKNSSLISRKLPTMPKPQWHPPWKLYRVISGHLGWVRCLAVEPGNQWFVTGSADRTIKIWDLASGKLKLSLTGHISTVRGVAVSSRSPYLFSCGEDKQVKCWDLEYNKVIRHYHGHLSAVYGLDLHPTIDVLITCGRDSTARVWDIRTKANVHTLTGHTNTVATVKCQAGEPQIITGSHDTTIRLWDLVAGKTRVTLTNHKKSVRSLILHPRQYTFASGSPDNIKQWKCPDGVFIQNLPGHNAIINTLSVNSDGVLVSGADNGTMHLWDWRTGYNFQRIHAAVQPGSLDSESGIFACTFDQSESRLLTAEADKTIKVYKEDDTATEDTHPVNWKPEIIKRKRF